MNKKRKPEVPTDPSKLSVEDLAKRIDALRSVTAIQCSNGNWDYDAYMLGLANGMILARSFMCDAHDATPPFLNKPKKWRADKAHPGQTRRGDMT